MKKRKTPTTETSLTTFLPGTRVVLVSTGECGVVVASWWEKEIGMRDYYVAFFGSRFPGPLRKPRKPYVLRYAESSLRPAKVVVGAR